MKAARVKYDVKVTECGPKYLPNLYRYFGLQAVAAVIGPRGGSTHYHLRQDNRVVVPNESGTGSPEKRRVAIRALRRAGFHVED